MNREYRIAKGWRIFIYIFIPLFAIGFIYMGLSPFLEKPASQTLYIVLPLFSIVLCAFLAWGFLDVQRGKLVVQDDRIIQVSAFRTKELSAAQVKGFAEDDKYVVIHPKEKGFPKIKISTYIGQLEELRETLAERFPNLDQEQYKAEEKQLLEDDALGATEKDRMQQLQQVRKLTRVINALAWVCPLWLIFYPQPYEIAIYTAMAILPVVLYTVYHYKGMVKIDENPKSAFPNLSTALLLPTIALMLRALLDYSIFEYSQLWIYVGICTALLYSLTLYLTKAYADKKQLAKSLLVLIFLGGYSYGTLVQMNCMDDQSVTQVYRANVLEKDISGGKHTTYFLKLERWGSQTKAEDVSVSKDLFNRVEEGQLMQVYFKQGRIGVPWFFVTE